VSDHEPVVAYVAIPPDTDAVLGVYVNGVQKQEGVDFEIAGDRIRFLTPVAPFRQARGARRVLLAVGIGVYDRGDQIDLQIHRHGHDEVVRAEATGTLGGA
jgi:hypothetical protein